MAFIVVIICLAIYLLARAPLVLEQSAGRILLFFGLFLLPLGSLLAGFDYALTTSEDLAFCASCHEMAPYIQSLSIADPEYLPAHHYQNRLVPRDRPCYTCHTNYAMFGPVEAKINGLRHVWVHYIGTVPKHIKLYKSYDNQVCLHCHRGSRAFVTQKAHTEETSLAELESGGTSCIDCHSSIHNPEQVNKLPKWKAPSP